MWLDTIRYPSATDDLSANAKRFQKKSADTFKQEQTCDVAPWSQNQG